MILHLDYREAHDEFQIVANSWRYSNDYSSNLFFVMVDIDEGGVDAFQQVGTNMYIILYTFVQCVPRTKVLVCIHVLFGCLAVWLLLLIEWHSGTKYMLLHLLEWCCRFIRPTTRGRVRPRGEGG